MEKQMKRSLFKLTPREAKVIAMRFGLAGNTDHTLEEVGKQLGVTRERVRQIEAKALNKLRRNKTLNSFWES
jgi:RNA polymerase primary sigma factor